MKKSLVIIIFAFIFLLSVSIVSAANDINQDNKISFGEWLKGLWGKITGAQTREATEEPSPVCLDIDGDGYKVGGVLCIPTDCNDNNANIWQNLYGSIDIDNDGYGTGMASLICSGASLPSGYASMSADCNATNPNINPGKPEICGDSLNNDCDGQTDEGCPIPTVVPPITCNSNLTISTKKCFSNDVLEINWTDLGKCVSNYTQKSSCDFNGNNLICESSPGIKDIGIGGNLIIASGNYTGIGITLVELAQLGGGGVDFNWNFSKSSLNFCDIKVEVADSSVDKLGYTLVKNVSAKNKTIWVERLNNSNKVCVKDIPEEILISDFSSKCNGNNEFLVPCPGKNSTYNCDIVESDDNSSWFKIWPLNHSAVKEISLISLTAGGSACTENWNCTDWTNITNECGTRTCNDLTNCGTIFDKPLEDKVCGGECISDWTCTNFEKCVDGIKERVCTDSNNCGVESDKPSETSECKKSSPLLIILISVGLLLVALLILYFIKRKKSEEEPSEEEQSLDSSSPSSPPSPSVASRQLQAQSRQPRLAPRY